MWKENRYGQLMQGGKLTVWLTVIDRRQFCLLSYYVNRNISSWASLILDEVDYFPAVLQVTNFILYRAMPPSLKSPCLYYVSPRADLHVEGMLRFVCWRKNQLSLPTPFYSALGVSFCLLGPFNWILVHKFSGQLSDFSLCSSGLTSHLLVLWNIYLKGLIKEK